MTKLMVLTAVVSFAFDQISKLYVVFWLDLINLQEIDVFAPFLNFRMAWHYGVNFGLFSGQSEVQRTALILIALGISAGVAIWAIRQGRGRLTPVAAGLLIGGALGNALTLPWCHVQCLASHTNPSESYRVQSLFSDVLNLA